MRLTSTAKALGRGTLACYKNAEDDGAGGERAGTGKPSAEKNRFLIRAFRGSKWPRFHWRERNCQDCRLMIEVS